MWDGTYALCFLFKAPDLSFRHKQLCRLHICPTLTQTELIYYLLLLQHCWFFVSCSIRVNVDEFCPIILLQNAAVCLHCAAFTHAKIRVCVCACVCVRMCALSGRALLGWPTWLEGAFDHTAAELQARAHNSVQNKEKQSITHQQWVVMKRRTAGHNDTTIGNQLFVLTDRDILRIHLNMAISP